MRRESVLSDVEKESFEIKKFIFHIIIENQLQPIYLDEVELEPEQVLFFKQRLIDVSEGVQHIFTDRDKSEFVTDCTDLLKDIEKNFVRTSKKLAYAFRTNHTKSTVDGVFVTAIVSVQQNRDLIFIVKIDHRKVYQYHLKGAKALLTELTQTFVEDKKAVQKSALIDITDYYAWDVLARERNPPAKKAIRDYFAAFLTVVEKDTPSSLTPKAASSIRQWAINNRVELDSEQDVSSYKSRAIGYLMGTSIFKTDDFIDAVIMDEDETRKRKLKSSLKAFLDEVGLSGQSFIPNKNSLTPATKKHVRETAEKVKIEWEGDPEENNITIPVVKDRNDGMYHILIKTSSISILDKA